MCSSFERNILLKAAEATFSTLESETKCRLCSAGQKDKFILNKLTQINLEKLVNVVLIQLLPKLLQRKTK